MSSKSKRPLRCFPYSRLSLWHRFCDVPIVTLHVGEGEDRSVFHVHKHLVCAASPVFNATFTGAFLENSTQMILLCDESRDVVEHFVQWLYTKNYGLSDYATTATADICFQQLAQLHVFADKYDISKLKNFVIDTFFELRDNCNFIPLPNVVTYVYDNSTKQSSFRRLLVAWYTIYKSLNWYDLPDTELARKKPRICCGCCNRPREKTLCHKEDYLPCSSA